MKKILVVKGQSAYNVLRLAADKICKGFENCGYQVDVIDILAEHGAEELMAVSEKTQEYEFYFSMQALFWNLEQQEMPWLKEMRRVGWIVDDPVYHAARLMLSTGKNANVLISRDSHAVQVRREYPKFDQVVTLYNGGFLGEQKTDWRKKDIDVFFPGTYMSLRQAEKEIWQMEGGFREIADRVKDRIVGSNLASVWQEELRGYLREINFSVSDGEFETLEHVMGPLDNYQRAYMRVAIIETLLQSGIKVTVVGAGWDQYEGKGRENLTILSDRGLDITEVIALMGRAKIVLNNTNILDGLHERIVTAMLANAVSVTNEYDMMSNFFESGKELVTFPLNEIGKLPQIVADLLANPDKAERIAEAGYKAALRAHTWERRGEQIIKWMQDGKPFTYEAEGESA